MAFLGILIITYWSQIFSNLYCSWIISQKDQARVLLTVTELFPYRCLKVLIHWADSSAGRFLIIRETLATFTRGSNSPGGGIHWKYEIHCPIQPPYGHHTAAIRLVAVECLDTLNTADSWPFLAVCLQLYVWKLYLSRILASLDFGLSLQGQIMRDSRDRSPLYTIFYEHRSGFGPPEFRFPPFQCLSTWLQTFTLPCRERVFFQA